jgi:hypothetical protein
LTETNRISEKKKKSENCEIKFGFFMELIIMISAMTLAPGGFFFLNKPEDFIFNLKLL